MKDKKKNLSYLLFSFLICGSIGTIILAIIIDVVLEGNISSGRYEETYDDMVKNAVLYGNMEKYMNADEILKQLVDYRGNREYEGYFFVAGDGKVIRGSACLSEGTDIHELTDKKTVRWELIKREKDTYYYCLIPVQNSDVALGIFCPEEVLTSNYREVGNIIISVALLVFAVSFILCFLLAMIPVKNVMNQNEDLEEKNLSNSRKLAGEYIEKILVGKSKIGDEYEYLLNASLPVDFKKSFRLVIFVPDWKWNELSKREEIPQIMNWLHTELNEFCENLGIWMDDEGIFIYCIQNQEKTDWNDIHADLMILQKKYTKQNGRSISIVIQRDAVFLEEMRSCYEKEREMIPYKMFRGFSCFLIAEDICEDENKSVDFIEIQNQVNEWTKDICAGKDCDSAKYMQLLRNSEGSWKIYHTVLFIIKTSLEQGRLIIKGNMEQRNDWEELLNYDDCLRKEEIEEKITQMIDSLVELKKDTSAVRQKEYVEKINRYIDKNYNDIDFSITQLAEEIGISAVYLSKIYKQVTDINIVDRVTNKRMETAAKILEEGNIATNMVYANVGYASNNYFYRVFKKYYGVTPRLYREMDCEGRKNLVMRKEMIENETK